MDVYNQSAFYGPDDLHRAHLSDARTWTHKDANVTLSWAGDHRRFAVCSDDSGRAGEAPGIAKLEVTVPHGDNRKRKDADRGTDGGNNQRTTKGFKLRGTNQYPTIVGLVNNQPFNYLGVINSTLQLNQSLKMSTCGLNVYHLQQLGLRPARLCDTQCHGTPFYMFNTVTMDYEPYVNNLQDVNFNLHEQTFFSPHQQLDYYGRRVAYDGRITNDMARVSNDRLSMPLQRSEEPSYGMYQLPADRLQQQFDQLPMKDRNPLVLNYDHVQQRPNCRTSQQSAAPVDARHSMTYSTQSPKVTHLYPAAAQPFYRGNANCTPEFNDYGTDVPPKTKKKKLSMVNTTRPELQDFDDTRTTLYSSLDHQ